MRMKILVACEYSNTVAKEFRKLGHDVTSCDLLPNDEDQQNHYQGDVFDIIDRGWDLMIAHPPCTYLSNSGVGHLYTNPTRWKDLIDGAVFFRELLNAPIPRIAIENPIQHKYASAIIGEKYSQVVQPWMFGHMESKATCLWLKGLPLLTPTDHVKEEMQKLPKSQQQRLHYLPPSKDRWKIRSTTYSGIAAAMAGQWG